MNLSRPSLLLYFTSSRYQSEFLDFHFNSDLSSFSRNFWNNLSNDKRKALLHQSNDDSIITKPTDKGGVIVIMDTDKYGSQCLKTLSDPVFCEELPSDPKPSYRQAIDETIDNLLSDKIIDEFEAEQMKDGVLTPCFYGLPNIHKDFDSFSPFWPICSGINSCTAKISEFVDVFLKPAAQQNQSYVRDTSHFVSKIENEVSQMTNPGNTFLVTTDVSSLYPDIDHAEGISACEETLSNRKSQSVPTSVISNLLKLILQCDTLKFGKRFSIKSRELHWGSQWHVTMQTYSWRNLSNLC